MVVLATSAKVQAAAEESENALLNLLHMVLLHKEHFLPLKEAMIERSVFIFVSHC